VAETIYHITTPEAWAEAQQKGAYEPGSLAREGFVHCSTWAQLLGTADRVFRGQEGLIVLEIDAVRTGREARYENLDGGSELYPHVYGPLPPEAVSAVWKLWNRPDGGFELPAEPEERRVFIRAREYDGSPHWEHDAWLVRADAEIVITRTEPDLPIARGDGGTYTSPYRTRAHYWPDRWFNVIRLEEPGSGQAPLSGFYCNIASPVEFDGDTVRYIDLQLDVRAYAAADGSLTYNVLDEDEFEAARHRYGYDAALVARCRRAVEQLIALIEARAFPFDV